MPSGAPAGVTAPPVIHPHASQRSLHSQATEASRQSTHAWPTAGTVAPSNTAAYAASPPVNSGNYVMLPNGMPAIISSPPAGTPANHMPGPGSMQPPGHPGSRHSYHEAPRVSQHSQSSTFNGMYLAAQPGQQAMLGMQMGMMGHGTGMSMPAPMLPQRRSRTHMESGMPMNMSPANPGLGLHPYMHEQSSFHTLGGPSSIDHLGHASRHSSSHAPGGMALPASQAASDRALPAASASPAAGMARPSNTSAAGDAGTANSSQERASAARVLDELRGPVGSRNSASATALSSSAAIEPSILQSAAQAASNEMMRSAAIAQLQAAGQVRDDAVAAAAAVAATAAVQALAGKSQPQPASMAAALQSALRAAQASLTGADNASNSAGSAALLLQAGGQVHNSSHRTASPLSNATATQTPAGMPTTQPRSGPAFPSASLSNGPATVIPESDLAGSPPASSGQWSTLPVSAGLSIAAGPAGSSLGPGRASQASIQGYVLQGNDVGSPGGSNGYGFGNSMHWPSWNAPPHELSGQRHSTCSIPPGVQ